MRALHRAIVCIVAYPRRRHKVFRLFCEKIAVEIVNGSGDGFAASTFAIGSNDMRERRQREERKIDKPVIHAQTRHGRANRETRIEPLAIRLQGLGESKHD